MGRENKNINMKDLYKGTERSDSGEWTNKDDKIKGEGKWDSLITSETVWLI